MITILAFLFACSTDIKETDVDTTTQEDVSCYEEGDILSISDYINFSFNQNIIIRLPIEGIDYPERSEQKTLFGSHLTDSELESYNTYIEYLKQENPYNIVNPNEYLITFTVMSYNTECELGGCSDINQGAYPSKRYMVHISNSISDELFSNKDTDVINLGENITDDDYVIVEVKDISGTVFDKTTLNILKTVMLVDVPVNELENF